MKRQHRGFTLIEILIVLAIIALLAALLFPAFKRAQESAYQASCATNLHQIYVALELYKNDERRYPGSLAFLMANDATLNNLTGVDVSGTPVPVPSPVTNVNGTGYLKSANQYLTCPDDDTTPAVPRSSYGDISNSLTSPTYAVASGAMTGMDTDIARYTWNYYGYDYTGMAFPLPVAVQAAISQDATYSSYLYNPSAAYSKNNPMKYSLSNRFAPGSTVVTHCIYHRLPTSGLNNPGDLYVSGNEALAQGAKEIVLRLDGTTKVLDVAQFKNADSWRNQTF